MRPVPTIAATVTAATPGYSPTSLERISIELVDVHDAVKQGTVPSVTVALILEYSPKLMPPTVIDNPPLRGTFVEISWYRGTDVEITGASKLNSLNAVPTVVATVTWMKCGSEMKPRLKQRILVSVVHIAVKQGASPRASVSELSSVPNERPRTVTDFSPDAAELIRA